LLEHTLPGRRDALVGFISTRNTLVGKIEVTKNRRASLGKLVARSLQRSWADEDLGDLDMSRDEFDQVTPLLYESGAAALGWRRIRNTSFRDSESGELLRQAHRLLTLRAAIHETSIQKAFRVLRGAGIEPILIKGWAIARVYPELALRPFGDVDLLVQPADYRKAVDIMADEAPGCPVDFHAPAFELADRPLDDVFARSKLSRCGDEQVRVLSAEDHFALLAVHLLKHAGWRPIWFCDLGLLLEREKFDWQICLGSNRQRTNWILAGAGVAHQLLGASIHDRTIADRAREVPSWLLNAVLKQWETPFASHQPPIRYHAPIASYLRRPRGLLRDLIRRWPNPISATVNVNGIFASRLRRRYQLNDCLMRAARALAQ
jgi:hypothetical protein